MGKLYVIIDNDSDDLESLEAAIKESDAEAVCLSFIFADEAVHTISHGLARIPDFIFIDVNMSRMTGNECLKTLSRTEKLRHSKIFMYSGVMPDAVGESFRQMGAFGYFQKPLLDAEYSRLIASLLRPQMAATG